MKIALAQLNYTVGDFEKNTIKIIENIHKARKEGAELVVFSEYAISGTPGYDLLHKLPFIEACEEALVEIASYCDDIGVIVGLPLQNGNKIISAAAYINNRRIVRYIGKKNIMNREEMGFISPSKGCEFIELGDQRIAVVVGEDLLVEKEYGKNVDLIVSIYSERYSRACIQNRYNFIRGLSYRSAIPVIFANYLGGQSEIVYDGSSCVYNGNGNAVSFANSFEEELIIVDPFTAEEKTEPEQNKTRNVYNAIKLALGDYFRKNGFTKACLGLSGGIDSAVVAALAAEVLGPENVHVLMMPSQFSSDHSVTDAVELADKLGITYDVIPITESYKTILESMIPVVGGTDFNSTEENVQARIRCIMLMALSNKYGHILLNTSNKSESAVGYSTMYGDSAGAFSILGDLYKMEVFDLARYINRNGEIIPENILIKEPSAELRPDQKDSDSLPLYDVLDTILYRFIEEGQSVEEISNAGFDEKLVRNILESIKNTEYKRRQACPVLRLSTRPFGSGFKLPLLNKFKL